MTLGSLKPKAHNGLCSSNMQSLLAAFNALPATTYTHLNATHSEPDHKAHAFLLSGTGRLFMWQLQMHNILLSNLNSTKGLPSLSLKARVKPYHLHATVCAPQC